MKLAVLSNINMDPLKLHLKKMNAPRPYFSAYSQHLLELMDRRSALYNLDLDTMLIHLDAEELLKDDFFRLPRERQVDDYLAEFLATLQCFCDERPEVSVIISSIVLPPFSFVSYLDGNSDHNHSGVEERMNRDLRNFAVGHHNVFILDFHRLVRLHGYKVFYDDKYWYLGRIKYAQAGFKALAYDLGNMVCSIRGAAKKVLVLDLDNTLWGGVLGEEGPNGIRLSEDGTGKAYRDFQKCIRALKSAGVILALNSKNNEDEVRQFMEQSTMMVLKYDDFVVRKINWSNKVDNLREIAAELNLGLDSMVLIDDSPTERALVKEYLREVAVPDFPPDAALLKTWFLSNVVYRYFPRIRLTEDDLKKSEQYERNVRRNTLGYGLNLQDFIASLQIKLKLIKNDPQTVTRIAQLTQKTNQFNLTTRRYTDADLAHYMESDRTVTYGLEYEDRFGPEGLIGACFVDRSGDVADLRNFLLSCRVLGRNVEYRFLCEMLEDLKKDGVGRITAEYIPSAKNAVAMEFYVNCGMKLIGSHRFGMQVSPLIEHLREQCFCQNGSRLRR